VCVKTPVGVGWGIGVVCVTDLGGVESLIGVGFLSPKWPWGGYCSLIWWARMMASATVRMDLRLFMLIF
jgi:hypothetical protein